VAREGLVTGMQGDATALPRTMALIERDIAEGGSVGAQTYVSLGGAPVADAAVGIAREGVAMTPATLMAWFSCTKAVTAAAVMQVWERGLLDLDDPVARHVPEFAQNGKGTVTVRHLLTHTGGFRGADTWLDGSGKGPSTVGWDEVIAKICAARLEPGWVPGRTAGYHPTAGAFMLGEIVRRLDGRPFDRYLREAIFEPLGMTDCWVGMPPERYRAYGDRIGVMHNTEGATPAPMPHVDSEAFTARCVPGGSGRGPMRQLGRFYEMLLGRGTLDGARILSAQTVEAMGARHRTGIKDRTFGHVIDWGLGVIVNSALYGVATVPYEYGDRASPRAFGHSGRQSSVGFCDPEYGLAVALLLNGQPGEARHQARIWPILTAIYEDLGIGTAANEPAKEDARA
jgi:CubicO group peptidase (beta-lactamase class C family)